MIILGSGNMATNLAHAFRKAGVRLDCIYSYTLEHAAVLAENACVGFVGAGKHLYSHRTGGVQMQGFGSINLPQNLGQNTVLQAIQNHLILSVLL